MKKHRGKYPMPTISIPGWMSGMELEWLYLKALESKTIVEVGCAYGRSSHALLTGNFETFGNEGKVYCVDPWPMPESGTKDQFDYQQKCTERRSTFFQRCGHFPNLNVIELPSSIAMKVLSSYPIQPDMVFLDGGTANMAEDIESWLPVSGFICGHDHSDEYPELKNQIERIFGIRFVENTSLWYVGKHR